MSEHCEVVKVPNEILLQILSKVSTSDVLQNCRLVSRRWNQAAAQACRNRQLKFKSGENFENLEICAATFKDPENVPWSAISLSTVSSKLAAHSGQVAEIFGQKITSLHLNCLDKSTAADFFGNLLKILSSTPNLRNLKIAQITDIYLWTIVPKLLETRLRDLSVEVTYTGQSLTWTLLANQRQFTLENLTLISIGPIPSVDYFRPLEQFLGSCGGALKTLKLAGFLTLEETVLHKSKLLKIPALPNLKTIAFLVCCGRNDVDARWRRGVHFEKLRAAHLPALKAVRFKLGNDWIGGDLGGLCSEVFGPLDGRPFATVTTLCLRDRIGGYAQWALRFPNVTQLAATLSYEEDVQGIVAHFSKLEVLHLTIKDYEDPIIIAMSKIVRLFPSLTALKRLVIRNEENRVIDPLDDAGAIVLTLLRPLSLKITNAQLSDNCVALLLQRHLHFELH